MLIVIAIILIVASSAMFAMYGASQKAAETRTRSQIAKLNELLMRRWQTYQTRSVPIRVPAGTDPKAAAQRRLDAIRELLRMELPERKSDVDDAPVTAGMPQTTLWLAYRAMATASWTTEFQDAECLYMIVSNMNDGIGNSSAIDFFAESEITDLDGDGMPELVDGWGNPFGFLRWAPGFVSDSSGTVYSDLQDGDPVNSHDPFDPLRLDDDAFALYPLVFSAGRDEAYDILRIDHDNASPPNNIPVQYSVAPMSNNPYATLPSSGKLLGSPFVNSTGYKDNITNHLLESN